MWSEEPLLERLLRRDQPSVLRGTLGDDTAILRAKAEVACVDACIEGVHFLPGTAPSLIGRKAAGRVLSDLAAAGANPIGLLVALTAPPHAESRRLLAILRALDSFARGFGAPLLGGDSSMAEGPVHLSVTGLGALGACRRVLGRSGARPGQLVVVTGPLGGSILGRHLKLQPRLAAGQLLRQAGASAMMDISDGLVRDASRLGRASGVGVEIDVDQVPIHRDARRLGRDRGTSALEHALHDGEDHELLAVVSRSCWSKVQASPRMRSAVVIGRTVPGTGVLLRSSDGVSRWNGQGGWAHGS